ncbi:hypothetical protein ACRAWC_12220 [Leifsonia sp. L25]|uniref:hypothetical protein n=1 Tax=Leifsonia sp. L25 TaxID=3423957 RepID=UPI003D69C52A
MRARGTLAGVADNAYLRLLSALVILAAGAASLVLVIGFALDVVVPLVFGNELRALAVLLPH